MLRRRQPPRAILLLAGALAAALAIAQNEARAQTTSGPESLLLRPVLDGNPHNQPRFRRSRSTPQQGDPSRFGQIQQFDYRPAFGAGTTGFDSTNGRRKGKAGQKRRLASAGDPGSQQKGSLTSKTDATPAAETRSEIDGPAPTPAQLQPATAALAGRARNQNRAGAPPANPELVTVTIATTPPNRRPPPEEKPFDPLGVQVGAFNLRPAMEYMRGYDNNPARNATAPKQSSWFNIYAPELLINSNWARHELTANVRGSYTTYDTMHSLDRPTADAKVNGRIDVTGQTRIDLEGRYLLFTDNPGSPNIQADLARLPIAMTYGSTAGVGHRFNRFEVALKGTFDRTVYNDSVFIDGQTSSNADRNYNQYGTLLRTSYELTPGVKPFVELAADHRIYDLAVDAGGVKRTSQGRNVKAGSTFEVSRKLTGELALGYLTRSFEDPTLEDIDGYSVDGALVWLASALTTVKLTATTSVAESTIPGVSGSFTREITAQVDHAFRRWLIATLKLARGFDDYVGSPREDYRYVASGALAYSLTRELQLKSEYRQEWRYSNIPGNNYWAHVWLFGLRLQR